MVCTTKARLQEGFGFHMTTPGFISPRIRSNGYGLDNKGSDLPKVSTYVSLLIAIQQFPLRCHQIVISWKKWLPNHSTCAPSPQRTRSRHCPSSSRLEMAQGNFRSISTPLSLWIFTQGSFSYGSLPYFRGWRSSTTITVTTTWAAALTDYHHPDINVDRHYLSSHRHHSQVRCQCWQTGPSTQVCYFSVPYNPSL